MADEQVTPPVVTQGNETAARTETGEIKDQQTTQTTADTSQKTTKDSPQSSAETKDTDTKAADKAKAETPAGAPEKYEAFKAPDNYEIDPKVVEEVSPIFKELNLSQDQAQKLVDVWNKHSIEAADAPYKQYEATRLKGREEIAKSELGNGTNDLKPEVRKNIDTAIRAIGDDKAITAFKEAMDLTGAGDNPAFVRAMNTFGKLLGEGTAVRAGAPAPVNSPGAGPRSAAAAMYPNLPTSSQA